MRVGILFGTYAAVNILAVLLIDRWLSKSSRGYSGSVAARVIVCFLYAALAFMPVLAVLIDGNPYQYALLKYSYVWMGLLMYFGGLLLTVSVIDLIAGFFMRKREVDDDPDKGGAGRAVHAFVFVLIVAAAIGVNVYGTIHAQDTVVTHMTASVDKQVKTVKKLRVALIADFHLSYNSDPKMIRRMVDKLNREKPDVVFAAGDMFSSSYSSVKDPSEYIKAFRGIKAKEGVFWIYGNHDVEEPLFCGFGLEDPKSAVRTAKMDRFLKKSGFTILEDSFTAVAGGEVQIAGRADLYKPVDKARKRLKASELLTDLDKEKPIIVLEHEPEDYKVLAKSGADISMSGHTHAGQIFPGTVFTRFMNDVAYGKADRYGMQVFVTSGVGCYGPPLRIGTNSEIMIIDIEFK